MSFLLTGTHVRSYWDVAGAHLPLALVTGLPIWLPYGVDLHQLPLRACTFLTWTGHPCPFCGFTRAFWALSHGDWYTALVQTPLSGLVYLVTALLFAWHGAALLIGVRLHPGPWFPSNRRKKGWTIIIVVLLSTLNWAYRLLFT